MTLFQLEWLIGRKLVLVAMPANLGFPVMVAVDQHSVNVSAGPWGPCHCGGGFFFSFFPTIIRWWWNFMKFVSYLSCGTYVINGVYNGPIMKFTNVHDMWMPAPSGFKWWIKYVNVSCLEINRAERKLDQTRGVII